MKLSKPEEREAVFGSFDGMTCLLGVLAALIVGRAPYHSVLLAVTGLAVSGFVGMASGEFLSDVGAGRIRRAMIMGTSTAIGSVIPAIPYLILPNVLGTIIALMVVAVMGIGIAHLRQDRGGAAAYIQTFTILILASGLSIGVALITGVA